MAETTLLREIMLEKSIYLFGYKGDNHGKDFFKRLSIQSMEFDSNES